MMLLGVPLPTLVAAGAATATALVALYLLRPPRRRVEVPYARLWGLVAKHAPERAPVRSLARRLRRLDSLLLQLLIAALILFALADPHPGHSGARSRHVILVDTSASMQAHDGPLGATRLERARTAIGAVIDALEPEEEAMLIAFDSSARAVSALTSNEVELHAAARGLTATDAPSALVPALRLCADALRGAERPRLTLIGDGAYDPDELARLPLGDGAGELRLAGVELRFVSVGTQPGTTAGEPDSDNVAITAFSVRRYPANPSAYELLVEVRSYSPRPRSVKLTITQEGEPVEVRALELPPHGVVQRRLTDLSGEGRRLEARLAVEGGDALALDDRAYALLADRRRTRVLLVGEGDLYAEGALLLDRAVDVERKRPAQYDAAALASYDAIVFDGYTPPAPPTRPALYLGCASPACPFATRGEMIAPVVTEIERQHPILRWVALKDLNVTRSATFALEHGDVALASALGKTILVAGERGGQRMVALGFAPSQSDLPLRVAFPVLLVNALEWLSGRTLEPTDSVRTGHPARLPASGNQISITTPSGEHLVLPVREGAIELDADRVGYYQLAGADHLIAANLADARESSLGARPLIIGGHPIEPPAIHGRLRPRATLWRWLVLAALALVLLEWHTYHRRWTV